MSASFYDLLKYAATGQASPDMTYYDKLRASTLMGGVVQTLTGQPPLTFKADGTPLLSWSMKGNGQQTGTPTPDNPVMPEFVGVRTGNLAKYWQNACVRATDGAVVSQQRNGMSYPVSVSAGQTITFSANTDNFSIGIAVFRDFDGTTPSDMIFRELTAYTYTATENCYVVVWCNYDNTTIMSESNFDLCKAMLNLGSTALPYEPYGWAEKITNAGQTIPVYLGEVPTVRRVRKLVLTGEETSWSEGSPSLLILTLPDVLNGSGITSCLCSHYNAVPNIEGGYSSLSDGCCSVRYNQLRIWFRDISVGGVEVFKSYLASEYAAGHPVTVWYVLATEQTGIVNEPLCKIGNYADELSSEDAAVTIPTANGSNTLTVDTELQPSEMTITFKG